MNGKLKVTAAPRPAPAHVALHDAVRHHWMRALEPERSLSTAGPGVQTALGHLHTLATQEHAVPALPVHPHVTLGIGVGFTV